MNPEFAPVHDSVVVLCYHGVTLELADLNVQTVHMPVSSFTRQLDVLARHYELISLDVLADLLRSRQPLGAPKAVITFDDGYRNVLTVAAPLLRARRIPFAVFVSTRNITTGERFPTYILRAALYTTPKEEVYLPSIDRQFTLKDGAARRAAVGELTPILKRIPESLVSPLVRELRGLVAAEEWPAIDARFDADAPLDWNGVRRLRRLGAVIGAHGHDHAILHQRQSTQEVLYQLTESKRMIESEIGPCRYFAYPNGGIHDISAIAARRLPACGYELGLAAVPGIVTGGAQPYLLPRIFVPPTLDALYARLTAAAENMPRYESWRASFGVIDTHTRSA